MSKFPVIAPGGPKRVQNYPLYELNFTKNGMQLVTPQFCSPSTFLSTEDDHAAELLICDAFLPDCFDSSFDNLARSSASENEILQNVNDSNYLLSSSGKVEPVTKFPISKTEFIRILHSLPSRFHFFQWKVIYDTTTDGFSLQHFYRRMNLAFFDSLGGLGLFVIQKSESITAGTSDYHPPLQLVENESSRFLLPRSPISENSEANIIGCFTPIVPCESLLSVPNAGSPETFVFRLEKEKNDNDSFFPDFSKYSHVLSTGKKKLLSPRKVRPFYCTRNSLQHRFIRCLHDGLSIGGGKDGPALWISKDLKSGTSSKFCETFCCSYLCGYPSDFLSHAEFKINRMIWLCMDKSHVFH